MSKYFGKCFGPSTRAPKSSFWLRCPSFLLSKFASQLKLIQSVVRVGIRGICVTSSMLRVLFSGFWVSELQFPSPRDPFSRVLGVRVPSPRVPDPRVSGPDFRLCSWDIGQYVYCNGLLTRLWRHKLWHFPYLSNEAVSSTWPKSQDKSVNILRTKRAFKMK